MQLYIFECKKGHGSFDGDKIRSIDQRLDRISRAIGAHAKSKGWNPVSSDIFLLSFYGATWKSKYTIYDRHSVASLFEPCVGRFVSEYMDHIEASTTPAYSSELPEQASVPSEETIFDQLFEDREEPRPDVLFGKDSSDFISAQTID